MMQHKLFLLVLVLLLISTGMAVAYSSTNYVVERFVTTSGGLADSTNYRVTSVAGQPVTDVVDSSNFKVTGGFLLPLQQAAGIYKRIWLPVTIE